MLNYILLDGASALITPEPGLMIWSIIIFVLLWIIVGNFAFKPIAKALRDRENAIDGALNEAKKAREEIKEIKSENEKVLALAKEERATMLKEAREQADKMLSEAKLKANAEFSKKVEEAGVEITNLKNQAIADVKSKAGDLAVNIAEKILKQELSNRNTHDSLINNEINNAKLN